MHSTRASPVASTSFSTSLATTPPWIANGPSKTGRLAKVAGRRNPTEFPWQRKRATDSTTDLFLARAKIGKAHTLLVIMTPNNKKAQESMSKIDVQGELARSDMGERHHPSLYPRYYLPLVHFQCFSPSEPSCSYFPIHCSVSQYNRRAKESPCFHETSTLRA